MARENPAPYEICISCGSMAIDERYFFYDGEQMDLNYGVFCPGSGEGPYCNKCAEKKKKKESWK